MNLSDYQKSGNAYNKTITPYPKFSLLAGKLPDVPGLSLGGWNYIFEDKNTGKFIESLYGRKHSLITQNGYMSWSWLNSNPIQVLSTGKAYDQSTGFKYDAFRQSLGSVPFQFSEELPILLRSAHGPDNIPAHSDGVENYQTSFVYDLPYNYSKSTGIKKIRFSGPKESPYEGKIADSTATDFGNSFDSKGYQYKIFNFKKEQYVYLFASVVLPPGINKSESYGDFYRNEINRLKLDFLSLFYTVDQKREGYNYQLKDLSFFDSLNLQSAATNIISFNGKGSQWDYDRTIRTSTTAAAQDWYTYGMAGNTPSQKTKEITNIAFKTLKSVESEVYTDLSFDVESEINLGSMITVTIPVVGETTLPVQEKVQLESGIPVSPIAMDDGSLAPLDQAYLTADITSKYNFFNSIWENALPNMPETAIPNIYKQTDEKPLDRDLTELFEGIANTANNCKSETELFAMGSDTRIIYIDDREFLGQANTNKDNYPMYNEIEFDIYPSANGEINSILSEAGITGDFLSTLLSYIYGPQAKVEDFKHISPESYQDALLQATNGIFKLYELGVITTVQNEDRFVSLKPSLLDSVSDPCARYEAKDLVYYDFENWFQNYLNALEIDGFESPPDSSVVPVIDENSYKEYTTKFISDVSTQSPFEKGGAWLAPVAAAIPELKDIFFEKMRTLNEIMSKQNSYSEPIMYKIEKFDETDVLIQTIFMPHYTDMTDFTGVIKTAKMRYIDTQVKYGHLYRYKITQLRIVVGTDYRYVFSTNQKSNKRAFSRGYGSTYAVDRIMSPLRVSEFDTYPESSLTSIDSSNTNIFDNEDQNQSSQIANFTFYTAAYDVQDKDHNIDQVFASSAGVQLVEKNIYPQDIDKGKEKLAVFKSLMYPNIKIVEVPYYEKTILVSDYPPLPPNVNFIPLIGKGSKILMTFEHQVGDREEIPLDLDQQDKMIFDMNRVAQERYQTVGGGSEFVKPSIRFKSDDFPVGYEIYTLDTPPSSYRDLKKGNKRELRTSVATAMTEDLIPNKTRYYMFRTEDVHNNISNPSPVYAVQMTLNSGVYFPVVSIYEFQEEKVGEKFKQFQQYLKIEASVIQRIVNRDKSEINSGTSNTSLPVLGIGNTSLWNEKKFKFRIISKHTGKAVDLNIRFKTNHTEPIKPIKTC
tara:strand:+ start:1936 stop:5394 length:3459 start_codon:yes stop_codon:yes gene_type:complete